MTKYQSWVISGANSEALAVAIASDSDFIRAEGFVFAHIGDEGFTQSSAGSLLRFRKAINAEHIKIYCDIQKKHSSHAITGFLFYFLKYTIKHSF